MITFATTDEGLAPALYFVGQRPPTEVLKPFIDKWLTGREETSLLPTDRCYTQEELHYLCVFFLNAIECHGRTSAHNVFQYLMHSPTPSEWLLGAIDEFCDGLPSDGCSVFEYLKQELSSRDVPVC